MQNSTTIAISWKKQQHEREETRVAYSKGKSPLKDGAQKLVDYHALPDYLKDNEYILSHYRVDLSLKHALRSLFAIHNETFNIWTHLLGFLLFLAFTILAALELQKAQFPTTSPRCLHQGNFTEHCILMVKTEITRYLDPMLKPANRWPFFVFLGGTMFCLLSSSICHLLSCHSERLSLFLFRLDYVGIAVMISTSFYPHIYYIFECTPIWQFVYLGTISIMGMITVIVLFSPACQKGEYRTYRAALFFSVGASGLIPAIHAFTTHWYEPICLVTLTHELLMAFFYGIGTFLYAVRIPEKWKPGFFDIIGHSHTLFHLLVVAGAYTHYRAALSILEWRDRTGCLQ